MSCTQVEKMHRFKFLILILLSAISFDSKCQEILDQEKYKVILDAINQIQSENAIYLVNSGHKSDTLKYHPIILAKKNRI